MTWAVLLAYAGVTAAIAVRASRGASTTTGFAIGSGRTHPAVAGITLGT